METTNKTKFVNDVLYSNLSIIANSKLYRDVEKFVVLQGDEFFEENALPEIFEAWEYFLDN